MIGKKKERHTVNLVALLLMASLFLTWSKNAMAFSLPDQVQRDLVNNQIDTPQMCPTLFSASDNLDIAIQGGDSFTGLDGVVILATLATFSGRIYDYFSVKSGEKSKSGKSLRESLSKNSRKQMRHHDHLFNLHEALKSKKSELSSCKQAMQSKSKNKKIEKYKNVAEKLEKNIDKISGEIDQNDALLSVLRGRAKEIELAVNRADGLERVFAAASPYFKKMQIFFGLAVVAYYSHRVYEVQFSGETVADYLSSPPSTDELLKDADTLLFAVDTAKISVSEACYRTMMDQNLLNNPNHIVELHKRFSIIQLSAKNFKRGS